MPSNFVHLHTHSHYSLLDGADKIDDLVDEAVKLGMPAIALDRPRQYVMERFGALQKCRGRHQTAFIGVETYIALESMAQKRPNIDNKRYHLILLAKTKPATKIF